MPTKHTARLGDCMSSLAAAYRHSSHAVLHDHPDNAALKRNRPNPNVLAEGDIVTVPDREAKQVDKPSGADHPFKIKLPHAVLRIVLQAEGAALADVRYKLAVGASTFAGKTGGDGKIEHPIPLDATRGTLELWPKDEKGLDGYLFDLDLGALEHESITRACQARLLNLGFDCGGLSGTVDAPTTDALKAFQKKTSLTENGTLDDPTKNKLRTEHEGA